MAAPYAATMFHFAPPDCAGSGVRISRPGWVRSLQSWMFFGFPLRTSNTTAPVATIDASGSCCQSWVMSPASWIVWTSGSSDSATMSACSPFTTACACEVLPPNDVRNWMDWPLCLSFQSDWNAEMSLP
jgi:hypothetical protein